MRIDVLTLFPEMFDALRVSVTGRAFEAGLAQLLVHNIRDYSANKHKTADDYPFGGGMGMVMSVQPVYDCYEANVPYGAHTVIMSPRGKPLTADVAERLSGLNALTLICGHYEGMDERVARLADEELSIGDYVLTGGELAAMVLIDALLRFVPGVIREESVRDESFSNGLLEYPQYTRPAEFRGMGVPEVLLSGHHARIAEWRRQQSLLLTAERRPELLSSASLTPKDVKFLQSNGISLA